MKPTTSLMDQDFKYYHSSRTNVQRTWRRFGWTPTEKTDDQQELVECAIAAIQHEQLARVFEQITARIAARITPVYGTKVH